MGDVVDFKKAKDNSQRKKNENKKRMSKNKRLAEKRRRYDFGKGFKPYHFYIALLIVITLIILITRIQP